MKKNTQVLIAFVLCLSFVTAAYFYYSNIKKNEVCNGPVSFIHIPLEIEPKYLITDQNEIVFSATNPNGYTLYTYKDGSLKTLNDLETNIFNPFLLKGKIAGLRDNNGDENFHLSDSSLNAYIGSEPVKNIFSFNNGYLLIIQIKNDNSVYLIDLRKGIKKIIPLNIERLHSVCFSKAYNFMILNYDNKLSSLDLNTDKITDLFRNETGDKVNPSISGKDIYFSDNTGSEYYRIFKISADDRSHSPAIIYQSDHDLRMPKVYRDKLFFIEIITSEYLLKSVSLKTKQSENITTKGVVYNYDLVKEEIIFSYSDFNTPKSIMRYKDHSAVNLTGNPVKPDLTYKFINRDKERSPAYIISPVHKDIKGIILFFHPGLNSDFSPRWDAAIMNLSGNGYVVVCPNFPMSSGYGKSYYNSDMAEAIHDIKKWKEFIRYNYRDIPLYYVSSSSGNVLMEQSLEEDGNGVNAAASFFGVPSGIQMPIAVPCLYILGQNDPIINFNSRNTMLKTIASDNINIQSYIDEGHWFRKEINLKDAVSRTIKLFCYNH